jgi:transcriptional regulator with XRE-family HTH domain
MSEVKTTSLATFAGQLRAWRKKFGWTQIELATKLGYSASLVSGVETMDKPPTSDFAKACDRVFDTPDTFTVVQELVAREAYPAFFAPVVPFEREAVRIHGWELGAIPGLLQTEDYARALIGSGRPGADLIVIDRLVAARLERQGIRGTDHSPMLWYVLDEGTLRHVVGSPPLMGAQLDALIEAAGTPSVVIQVLPFTADNYAGTDGSITVYEFADSPTVCYTECYSGGRVVEVQSEVSEVVTVLNLIRASALSPRESLELIRRIQREIND